MPLDSVQQAAREQFARQSRNYGRGHILADVSDVIEALRSVELPARARVLDVAAGGGHTGLHLASLGHDVTCSDLAGAMLERVQEAAAGRGLSVETREHAAERLPYPDASFDLVTSRVAPHHFSSPRDFIHETSRVLGPGGFLLLIDGSVEDGQPEAEAWSHELEKLRDPSHARFFTPKQWRGLCEEAGLRVVRSELHPMKQPDLEWYFETAATTPENRAKVREMIATAPASARALFRLGEEEGRVVWWWQRLTLIATKGCRGLYPESRYGTTKDTKHTKAGGRTSMTWNDALSSCRAHPQGDGSVETPRPAKTLSSCSSCPSW